MASDSGVLKPFIQQHVWTFSGFLEQILAAIDTIGLASWLNWPGAIRVALLLGQIVARLDYCIL